MNVNETVLAATMASSILNYREMDSLDMEFLADAFEQSELSWWFRDCIGVWSCQNREEFLAAAWRRGFRWKLEGRQTKLDLQLVPSWLLREVFCRRASLAELDALGSDLLRSESDSDDETLHDETPRPSDSEEEKE